MKAVLSCTDNDLYLFNLPFAIYSWWKLGVDVMVMVPGDLLTTRKYHCILEHLPLVDDRVAHWYNFSAPKDKEVTYAQCARLYGAAVRGGGIDVLITSDADMCVFNKKYWRQFGYNPWINVIGVDLVPDQQVPICYISMLASEWQSVMGTRGKTLQQCLDELLGDITAEDFRGNYWAKDQETAYNYITQHNDRIRMHKRASPGTQFATRRADRDGWAVTPDIIDAHLPRPGYTSENFEKIIKLFENKYPGDSTFWMHRYRANYIKLMEL